MTQPCLDILILAAGKGVRMHSALPKVLFQLCGKTLIARVLQATLALGPKQIIVVVGHEAEAVKKEIDSVSKRPDFTGISISTVYQSEQKGTGHAVQIAAGNLKNEFVLILPGDVPLLTSTILKQTWQFFTNEKHPDLLCLTTALENPKGYGRIVRSETGKFIEIVEHRDCKPEQLLINEINTSVYLVRREFLLHAISSLSANNAQGELYLTDIIRYGAEKGASLHAFCLENSAPVSGVNSRAELSVLEAHRRSEINKMHMENGVSLENSENTYIDEDVIIEPDTFIGAGTKLKGNTQIGRGTIVQGNSIILDSKIAENCLIKLNCYIDNAKLAANSAVGPFAHLRPGTELRQSARIGNFVEVKKSVIGAGAKANHLTYIGDAEVGENANIGAGTITCNYDGVNKYQTVIEEGAFIGSNSSLVAPIRIGAGAVIGAGSVVSKDIPAGALGVERSGLSIIPGWVKKRSKKKEK